VEPCTAGLGVTFGGAFHDAVAPLGADAFLVAAFVTLPVHRVGNLPSGGNAVGTSNCRREPFLKICGFAGDEIASKGNYVRQ
jgi:hypothetical protein